MKVFVTISEGRGWLRPRLSVVWGESAYMVKTFRQCGWSADFVFEGTCEEDDFGGREFKVERVLEGADNPLLPIIINYLVCL